jgi:hypothetical protein
VTQVLKHEKALRGGRVADLPMSESGVYTLEHARPGEAEAFQDIVRSVATPRSVKAGVLQNVGGSLSTASGKVLTPTPTPTPAPTTTPTPATTPAPAAKPAAGSAPSDSHFGGPDPAAALTGKGAVMFSVAGALLGANDLVAKITGKSPLDNFFAFVRGGLGDPEARLRFGEGLHSNKETRDAAAAAARKREIDQILEDTAKREGISVDEARRRWTAQARASGPASIDVAR